MKGDFLIKEEEGEDNQSPLDYFKQRMEVSWMLTGKNI